ncbi:MAG: small multi-drug export protein [Candidatus Thermoplasmatota archaeon]
MQVAVRIQLAGLALATASLGLLVLVLQTNSSWGAGLAAAMAAELVTGREVTMPLALVTGIPTWWVALASVLQNLALAALLVPMVQRAMVRAPVEDAQPSFVQRLFDSLRQTAASQLAHGRGPFALFLFMLVPFLTNGAVVAGLVGLLAGLQWRALCIAVTAGVVATSLAWAYAHQALSGLLASVDGRLAALPALVATLIALLWAAASIRSVRAGEREVA